MIRTGWLAFQYRGFHDVPRTIVVEFRNALYVLDCPFDEGLDEYPDEYTAYRLPKTALSDLGGADWTKLAEMGRAIGRVRVADVEFDSSKRKAMHPRTLERLVGLK